LEEKIKELSSGTQYLLSKLSELKDKERKTRLVVNTKKSIKAFN